MNAAYPRAAFLLKSGDLPRYRFRTPEGGIDGPALKMASRLVGTAPGLTAGARARLEKATGRIVKAFETQGIGTFAGIPIVVEFPAGSTRSGVARDGTPWTCLMQAGYGFLLDTVAPDDEELDAYFGPDEGAPFAYVVQQLDGDGCPDELKVMLGFGSAEAAQASYLAHTPAIFYGGIWGVPLDLIRSLLGLEGIEQGILLKTLNAALSAPSALAVVTKGGVFVGRIVSKATWAKAYVNELPDSAFLHVEPGGSKDDDGKTVPRTLRHFPVRDKDGNVDEAHVRDALSRIPQAKLPDEVKSRCTREAEKLLADIVGETKKAAEGPTFLEHARAWVTSRGLLEADSDYAGELGKAVVRMAELFSAEGHSGMSAKFARAYFNWLCDGWDGMHTMMLDDKDFAKAKAALAKTIKLLVACAVTKAAVELVPEAVGYYTSPDAAPVEPTSNTCPICGAAWTPDDVRTVSLMAMEGPGSGVSLFYRMHRTCAEAAAEDVLAALDEQALAHAAAGRLPGQPAVELAKGRVEKASTNGPAGHAVPKSAPIDPVIEVLKRRRVVKFYHVQKDAPVVDKRLVYGIVLEPEPNDGAGDAHVETYSADVVEAAAHGYLLYHRNMTDEHGQFFAGTQCAPVESYIVRHEHVDQGTRLRVGTWVMVTKVFDDDVWQRVLSGELTAYSIGGYAERHANL